MNIKISLVFVALLSVFKIQAMDESDTNRSGSVIVHDREKHAEYLQEYQRLNSSGEKALQDEFIRLKSENVKYKVLEKAESDRITRNQQIESDVIVALKKKHNSDVSKAVISSVGGTLAVLCALTWLIWPTQTATTAVAVPAPSSSASSINSSPCQ